MWMNAYLKLLLVMCCTITSISASTRADLQRGFKLCPGNQLGRVVSVETDGPGCKRRNGLPQWPCFIRPGQDGVFRVSFVHYQPSEFITITSSIHAIVTFSHLLNIKKHLGLPGEVDEYACDHIQPGCPIPPGIVHSIQKKVICQIQLCSWNKIWMWNSRSQIKMVKTLSVLQLLLSTYNMLILRFKYIYIYIIFLHIWIFLFCKKK